LHEPHGRLVLPHPRVGSEPKIRARDRPIRVVRRDETDTQAKAAGVDQPTDLVESRLTDSGLDSGDRCLTQTGGASELSLRESSSESSFANEDASAHHLSISDTA
jgi:hypothetical protein